MNYVDKQGGRGCIPCYICLCSKLVNDEGNKNSQNFIIELILWMSPNNNKRQNKVSIKRNGRNKSQLTNKDKKETETLHPSTIC